MSDHHGPSAFESVVLPHLDEAYNFAHWLMGSAPEAEDVVQEAMLRALTYLPSFEGTNARVWVLQILRHVAYARLSLGAEEAASGDEEQPALPRLVDPLADPEALVAAAEDRDRLATLIAALPVTLRECLILHDISGFSYENMASITGTSVGTAMARLWRARRLLAKLAARSE